MYVQTTILQYVEKTNAAILDGIATDLGFPKQPRKTTGKSKMRCPTGEASTAEFAGMIH